MPSPAHEKIRLHGSEPSIRLGPSYVGLKAASERARKAAYGASKKSGTRCEMLLRRALWSAGLRYRVNRPSLPGRPDLVFAKARVVIFCDGDFWHGRDLAARLARLAAGHNAPYWVAKIRRNVERDRETDAALSALGWKVLRFWETEILREIDAVVKRVKDAYVC